MMLPAHRLPQSAAPSLVRRSQQKGIATIFTLLLVGMSLTAAVMGAAYYIQGRQAQSLSMHAQTQAQLNAWTAAQLLQAYWDELAESDRLDAFMELPTNPPIPLQITGQGLAGLVDAQITHIDTQARLVTAKITGSTAASTRAQASAILEVVYQMAASAQQQCKAGEPFASVLIKGNLAITGGESGFESATGLLDILVDGDMTIKNASQAGVSACAKGNIEINGGGVKPNAKIYSQNGSILLSSMTAPVNADVWGNTVTMQNFGQGSFQTIRAGAYQANLIDGSNLIWGQAYVGGTLIADTAYGGNSLSLGGVPFKQGMLVPHSAGQVPISHNGAPTWLLDLSKASINYATGAISNLSKALVPLAETAPALPATLYFQATGVSGGSISLNQQIAQQLWGYDVSIDGYSGQYGSVWAAGKLSLHTQNSTGSVLVGGDLVYKASHTTLNANSATVAGQISGYANASQISGITRDPKSTPGLPGRPYCDISMPPVNVTPYKAQSNYVFEYVGGKPYVTIQNVKNNDTGALISGTYPMDGTSAVLKDIMVCDWGNNKGCTPSSSDITNQRWVFGGMTKFPVGTVWFGGDVSFTPAFPGMLNTILSTGNVELGNGTGTDNKLLIAPSQADEAALCQTPRYVPEDICRERASGTLNALRNMGLMQEKNLLSNGWKVYGNIQVGAGLGNASNATTIYGSLSTGLNTSAGNNVSFSSGGLIVKTNTVTPEQLIQPGGKCESTSSSGSGSGAGAGSGAGTGSGTTSSIKWSRYL